MCAQVLSAWEAITGPQGTALQSPHAQAFYARVDWQHVLGWPPERPAPPYYQEYLQRKITHSDKIIALRLNQRPSTSQRAFYVIGCDAVLVAELLEIKGENMLGKCVLVCAQQTGTCTVSLTVVATSWWHLWTPERGTTAVHTTWICRPRICAS
jgi:hypothetical protein